MRQHIFRGEIDRQSTRFGEGRLLKENHRRKAFYCYFLLLTIKKSKPFCSQKQRKDFKNEFLLIFYNFYFHKNKKENLTPFLLLL